MLLVEPQDGWCRLVLHRPDPPNALETALLGRLAEELGRPMEDAGCRAVVPMGTRDKAEGPRVSRESWRPAWRGR